MVMPSAMLAPLDPIVIPLMVIVNADALMEAPEIVMTTAVEEVALHVAARPETLLAPVATVGVMEEAKKFEGQLRVMVPPEGIGVVAVKARVTGTDDLPAMRSDEAMVKDTDETRDKIPPDVTEFDIEQKFVCNLTPTEPAVGAPMVNPPIVMVNADALMAAPDIVIMTAVEEVLLQVTDKPALLLEPAATVGVRDGTKKLEG